MKQFTFLISVMAIISVLFVAGCTQQSLEVMNTQKAPMLSQSVQSSTPEIKTTSLSITGMTCDMCVANVTGRLKGVDGVISANVSLTERRAVVSYDPSKTNIDELIASVNSSTKFKAFRMSEQIVTLNINGMMCEGCANATKSIIEDVDGVISVNVSFEDKTAIVRYDAGRTSVDKVISAVNASPKYTAELVS
jgi:copper ion binding protein